MMLDNGPALVAASSSRRELFSLNRLPSLITLSSINITTIGNKWPFDGLPKEHPKSGFLIESMADSVDTHDG